MNLSPFQPAEVTTEITNFLRLVFKKAHKKNAVIGVSGGIDSSLVVTLLVKALGKENVWPVLLPYGDQDMTDGQTVIDGLAIPVANQTTIDIAPLVDEAAQLLGMQTDGNQIRLGNIKARMRMVCLFDLAKKLDGLVCGTENKSEHYLGYFTRFGDAASDVEPISTLYKTQVREVGRFLEMPEVILTKAPSAGLWAGQSDEDEMGFTYAQADQVLIELIDHQKAVHEIKIDGVSSEVVQAVAERVADMAFKRVVPYTMGI
jgi:NAD+ synthase